MPNPHVRWVEFFNELSTTNMRIFVTLACVFITTVAYMVGLTVPSWEWLLFLSVMAGIDAAQYTSMRVTYNPEADRIKHEKKRIADKE